METKIQGYTFDIDIDTLRSSEHWQNIKELARAAATGTTRAQQQAVQELKTIAEDHLVGTPEQWHARLPAAVQDFLLVDSFIKAIFSLATNETPCPACKGVGVLYGGTVCHQCSGKGFKSLVSSG